MYSNNAWHLGAWLPVIVIFGLLIAAFEVWMIVDVALNKKISDRAKVWWIIGMVLIHPFVAIAYYFTDHRKR